MLSAACQPKSAYPYRYAHSPHQASQKHAPQLLLYLLKRNQYETLLKTTRVVRQERREEHTARMNRHQSLTKEICILAFEYLPSPYFLFPRFSFLPNMYCTDANLSSEVPKRQRLPCRPYNPARSVAAETSSFRCPFPNAKGLLQN